MNKIHKKLGLKTKSLGEEGNCEVFTSYMINKNYTWNENLQKSESSRIVGTCIRKPGINSMRRKILDGYFCVDDLDFKNQLNLIECEYSLLSPYTFNDICMEFPYTFSLDEEKEIVFEELYASGNKVLESHNQKITKIQMLQELSYFELINNMGLHGYGYKASSYLQFDLYSQKGLKTQIGKYYSGQSSKEIIPKAIYDLEHMEVRLSTKKREDIPEIKVIYLTSQAYAQLLNVLFQVITDSRVNKESLCLKKLKENGLKISNKININVNSPYNLVYNGNIDGEGHLLSDRVLCNNGDIKKYISSYSTGGIDNEDSIISGFRFDYRQNPISKVYGIYVSPGKHSISEIITKYDSVAKIDFFQGLEEGLNQSLNFAAIVNIEFLEGGKYIGSSRREISSNVIHLLENVVEVSSNMSYELDGSIKLPDVIIESSL